MPRPENKNGVVFLTQKPPVQCDVTAQHTETCLTSDPEAELKLTVLRKLQAMVQNTTAVLAYPTETGVFSHHGGNWRFGGFTLAVERSRFGLQGLTRPTSCRRADLSDDAGTGGRRPGTDGR